MAKKKKKRDIFPSFLPSCPPLPELAHFIQLHTVSLQQKHSEDELQKELVQQGCVFGECTWKDLAAASPVHDHHRSFASTAANTT